MYNVLVSQCYFVHWPIVSVSSRVSVIVLSCHSTKNLNLLGGCCKGIDSPDTCGGVLLQQRIWVHMDSPSKLQGVKTNCTKGLGMISLYYNHGFWKHVTHICNLLSSKDLDLILLISHVENLWGVIFNNCWLLYCTSEFCSNINSTLRFILGGYFLFTESEKYFSQNKWVGPEIK